MFRPRRHRRSCPRSKRIQRRDPFGNSPRQQMLRQCTAILPRMPKSCKTFCRRSTFKAFRGLRKCSPLLGLPRTMCPPRPRPLKIVRLWSVAWAISLIRCPPSSKTHPSKFSRIRKRPVAFHAKVCPTWWAIQTCRSSSNSQVNRTRKHFWELLRKFNKAFKRPRQVFHPILPSL